MADKNPTAHDPEPDPSGPELEAINDEALVLDRLLSHWPTQLQETDLARELSLGDDDFDHRDRVNKAVNQLCWAGLVARSGPFVIPTRPTFQYHLLSEHGKVDI